MKQADLRDVFKKAWIINMIIQHLSSLMED